MNQLHIRCAAAAFAAAAVLFVSPKSFAEPVQTNVASRGEAWVSATYPLEVFSPENVTDGDTTTGWASAYYPTGYSFWALDLGYSYDISLICFYGRNEAEEERSAFRVEGADKKDFSDADVLYEILPGEPAYAPEIMHEIEVDARYRYIRFMKNDRYDTHLTLNEVEVWTQEYVEELCAVSEPSSSEPGTDARLAIDGKMDTMWQSVPSPDEMSYWQADFGETAYAYTIETVSVMVGNTEKDPLCGRRFCVMLSNDSSFSDGNIVYEHGDVVSTGEIRIDLSKHTQRYRYLRVQKTRIGEPLAIYDVKVFARPYLGENAAANRYAYANTVHSYSPAYHPGAAVDGNHTTFWCSNECTLPEEAAMITVDLGTSYSIQALCFETKTLWGNCDGFTIQFSERKDFVNAITIYDQPKGKELRGEKYLYLETPVSARYIRVQKKEAGQMLGVKELKAFTADPLYEGAKHPGFVCSMENQTPIFEVPYDGRMVFYAELQNMSENDVNGTLYFARKSGEILMSVQAFSFTIPANTESYALTRELSAKEEGIYSCYVWTEATQKPLCENVEIVRFR